MRTVARRLLSLVSCLAAGLAVAPSASAAPLTGSVYDSGDGNQDTQFTGDWQSADTEARVKVSPDANDDCFIGGVKENTPNL